MSIKYYHLIVPDLHVPYHDHEALMSICKFANQLSKKGLLNTFIVKGDFVDLYSMSQHGVKDPNLHNTLLDEIQECIITLDLMDKALGAHKKKVFMEGNHEHRLKRFIRNKAVELEGYFSLEERLMHCGKRKNWSYIPYTSDQLYKLQGTDLYVRHEPYGSSSQASIKNGMVSLNHGHDHKIHKTVLKNAEGKRIEVSSDGCLIDMKSPAFSYLKKFPTWTKGFGLVTVTTKGWFHQTIEIKNDHFVIGNKVYEIKRS